MHNGIERKTSMDSYGKNLHTLKLSWASMATMKRNKKQNRTPHIPCG